NSTAKNLKVALYDAAGNVLFERQYNNYAATILDSAARTTTTNSAPQINYCSRAMIFFVNVSSITASPVLTPSLQIKDSISGNYMTIWTAAATITTATTFTYLFDIGGVGGAGSFTEAANIRVGRTWRWVMTAADADSATYSVSCENLL
ncbi:MAG: hypothetical protein Q7N50_10570, partial [Armatimonadota bacterium]|nr:hypothetical protein [Armatimonadota bacterium]